MKQTSMLIYYVILKTEIDPGCISWKTMHWKSRRMKNCFERWPNCRQLLSGCFLFSHTAWDGFPSSNLYQMVFCLTEFRLWRLSRLLIWILPMTDVDWMHSELFHHDWDSEDFLTFFHKASFSSNGFYKIPFILILSLDSIYSGWNVYFIQ